MNIFLKSRKLAQKGYTLLEMLIVIMLVGVLMSTVFSIIFVVLRQQVRIYRIIETRRQGDAILNFMKEKIARSNSLEDDTGAAICAGPVYPSNYTSTSATGIGADFVIIDDASAYQFQLPVGTNTLLYSDLAAGINSPLHINKVEVSAFSIACSKKTLNSSTIVQFQYTVTYRDITQSIEEGTQILTYRAKVKLR